MKSSNQKTFTKFELFPSTYLKLPANKLTKSALQHESLADSSVSILKIKKKIWSLLEYSWLKLWPLRYQSQEVISKQMWYFIYIAFIKDSFMYIKP